MVRSQRMARATGLAPERWRGATGITASMNCASAGRDFLQDRAQIVAHLRHLLITVTRVFRQRAIQNLLQARRDGLGRASASGFGASCSTAWRTSMLVLP